jgi:RimJ/RimL family protein N-acetyltransferase
LRLEEVVSFTSESNLPSQKVMQAIGMQQDLNGSFEHPRLAEGHPLRPHVLYRIDRAHWERTLRA